MISYLKHPELSPHHEQPPPSWGGAREAIMGLLHPHALWLSPPSTEGLLLQFLLYFWGIKSNCESFSLRLAVVFNLLPFLFSPLSALLIFLSEESYSLVFFSLVLHHPARSAN